MVGFLGTGETEQIPSNTCRAIFISWSRDLRSWHHPHVPLSVAYLVGGIPTPLKKIRVRQLG